MSDTNISNHERAKDAVSPERGVLELLGEIKSGRLAPKDLKPEDRRACVQHLGAEGYSVPEIAQVLKFSERTIARDRKANQEASALAPDPAYTPVLVGQLMIQMQTAIDHIRRITRDRETPAAVRVDGEHRCYQIQSDFVQRLQRLGYMPTAATRVEADLTHHLGEVPGYEQQMHEIRRIRGCLPEGSSRAAELDHLLETAERATLQQQIQAVESVVTEEVTRDGTA